MAWLYVMNSAYISFSGSETFIRQSEAYVVLNSCCLMLNNRGMLLNLVSSVLIPFNPFAACLRGVTV